MLDFKTKLKIFNKILEKNETPYIENIYESIYMFSENMDFEFLNKLNSKQEIEDWVTVIRGRIIMHEDEAGMEDIFNDFVGL